MDSRTTFVILTSQILHQTSRMLITSPLSSKRPWPYLIAVHSDGIHTLKRSRTSVAPEQKLTAEGFDKSRLAQFSTRKIMASGKTLIFLMGLPLSLLFPGLLSFSPWPIFNTLSPSHPVADFRTAFNSSKNPSCLMLRFSDSYGRELHSGWISTSTLWFCDDIDDHTQLQSSTTKLRQYLILSINWLWLARVQAFVSAEYELLVFITTDPFRKDPTSIHTLLLWIQHPLKEPIHRTSLTAGDNLGPLLVSYPVSMSRTHDNFSFGGIVFVSENCSRFGESKFPPSPFNFMFRLYGLIGRGLPSGLETTSLDWP